MHVQVPLPTKALLSCSFLLPSFSLLSLTIDVSSADDEEAGVTIDLDTFSSLCSCWSTDEERREEDSDRSDIIMVDAVCMLVRILVSDQVFSCLCV
jgi:hypothetical protein